ncbi:MAG: TrmH family RNA methyltransferase [Planctomycetota bacterium]|jgi:TrmH family RNA methyltransferase
MKRRTEINSSKNPALRRYVDAGAGKEEGAMLVEGVKLVWDALSADLPVVSAAVSPKLSKQKSGWDLRRRLEQTADEFLDCSDQALQRVSSLTTQQGVAAILQRPACDLAELVPGDYPALIVAAAQVKDPGNLGAIMRAAEASGASGMLTLSGGADPFREKAVRGSAGSVFRLPIVAGMQESEFIDFAKKSDLQVIACDATGEDEYLAADYRRGTVLILGGEGGGLPAGLLSAADSVLRIPMQAPVESLNVAVAAGVVLFEARRQRK